MANPRLVRGPTMAIRKSAPGVLASPELGDAAEEPQHDALDLDAVAAGHQRMGQLVGQQRGQEQHRGNDCGDHVGGDAAVRKGGGQLAGREPTHQDHHDEKHTGVDPDLDAGDAAQRDGRSHQFSLRRPHRPPRSPVETLSPWRRLVTALVLADASVLAPIPAIAAPMSAAGHRGCRSTPPERSAATPHK